MSAIKFKKDDLVRVITGKDKGKEGKIKSINKKDNTVIVEGINMVSKHSKPSAANQQGGIIQMESPIDISNVMYVHKNNVTRIGYKIDGDKKVRVAKSTGDILE